MLVWLRNTVLGAGEMTQQVRELAVFEENLSLIPSNCVGGLQALVTPASVELTHTIV